MKIDAAIKTVANLLYQKGVDLVRFQFNARCEGGVTGLIWNDDIKEYYVAEMIAFITLYLSTPWSIRLRYAEYGIQASRIVYSVVDYYALSFLEALNKSGIIPQCPKCNRFYDEQFGCEEHYQEELYETRNRVQRTDGDSERDDCSRKICSSICADCTYRPKNPD